MNATKQPKEKPGSQPPALCSIAQVISQSASLTPTCSDLEEILAVLRAMLPNSLNFSESLQCATLADCKKRFGAVSEEAAKELGMFPITYVMHPDHDREALAHIMQDMIRAKVRFCLVAKPMPSRFTTLGQRGHSYGIEVWRSPYSDNIRFASTFVRMAVRFRDSVQYVLLTYTLQPPYRRKKPQLTTTKDQ